MDWYVMGLRMMFAVPTAEAEATKPEFDAAATTVPSVARPFPVNERPVCAAQVIPSTEVVTDALLATPINVSFA
jgi:hypothetical protein